MVCWEETGQERQHFSIVSAKRFPVTVRLRYMTERMIFWTFHKSDLHMRIRFYQNFYLDINKDKIKDKKSIPEYFDMIKIKEEDWYRLIKDYSHGMKNKMQMICFLITKPPVILLDEPLTSFDVVVAHEIKQMLKAMKQDHIIIFSTHILELAEDLCDEIVILNQGKLEAIDHNMIGAPEFEEKIFEALKEEQHD